MEGRGGREKERDRETSIDCLLHLSQLGVGIRPGTQVCAFDLMEHWAALDTSLYTVTWEREKPSFLKPLSAWVSVVGSRTNTPD